MMEFQHTYSCVLVVTLLALKRLFFRLLTTIATTRNALHFVTCCQYDQSSVKSSNSSWETLHLLIRFVWSTKSNYHSFTLIWLTFLSFDFCSSPPLSSPVRQRLLYGLKRCWSQWWWLKAPRWFYPATPHQACLLRSPSGWTAVSTNYTQIYTQVHWVCFSFSLYIYVCFIYVSCWFSSLMSLY